MKIILSALFIILFSPFVAAQQLPQLFHDAEMRALKNIRDLAISPSGTEIYFTHQHPAMNYSTIYFISLASGKWSSPKKVSFSGKHQDMEPFFHPLNGALYFVSDRPHEKSNKEKKDFDIWYVTRLADGTWSEPIHPDAPFNTAANEFYPSICSNGDLYFTADMDGSKGKDDIFYCRFESGIYATPVSLSDSINTSGYEYNAFVAPDGSYLIYTSYKRPDGLGSGDLYISYSLGNDKWSAAKNMGPSINSATMDYCPFVHEGILYFTSKRGILELTSKKEVAVESEKFPGGRSRIYEVHVKDLLSQ